MTGILVINLGNNWVTHLVVHGVAYVIILLHYNYWIVTLVQSGIAFVFVCNLLIGRSSINEWIYSDSNYEVRELSNTFFM